MGAPPNHLDAVPFEALTRVLIRCQESGNEAHPGAHSRVTTSYAAQSRQRAALSSVQSVSRSVDQSLTKLTKHGLDQFDVSCDEQHPFIPCVRV